MDILKRLQRIKLNIDGVFLESIDSSIKGDIYQCAVQVQSLRTELAEAQKDLDLVHKFMATVGVPPSKMEFKLEVITELLKSKVPSLRDQAINKDKVGG